MLTIRAALPEEAPRLKHLWKKCFGDPDDYIDLYFRDYWEPDQALVAEEEGRIVGYSYAGVFKGRAAYALYSLG